MFGLSNIWPLRRSAHTGPANRLQPRPFRCANIQGSDGQVKSGKNIALRAVRVSQEKSGNFTSQVHTMVFNL